MAAEIGDRFFNGVKGFSTDIATIVNLLIKLCHSFFVVVTGFFLGFI